MYHLLLKQAIKIDETIRRDHHFCELWIHNAACLLLSSSGRTGGLQPSMEHRGSFLITAFKSIHIDGQSNGHQESNVTGCSHQQCGRSFLTWVRIPRRLNLLDSSWIEQKSIKTFQKSFAAQLIWKWISRRFGLLDVHSRIIEADSCVRRVFKTCSPVSHQSVVVNVQKCAKVCKSVQKCAKVCKVCKVCKSVQTITKVYKSVQKCTKVCKSVQQ